VTSETLLANAGTARETGTGVDVRGTAPAVAVADLLAVVDGTGALVGAAAVGERAVGAARTGGAVRVADDPHAAHRLVTAIGATNRKSARRTPS
jgi:hypothetical protein